MNICLRLKAVWIVCTCVFLQGVNANSVRWVSVNTSNARPVAMGSAFQAVEDRWAGIHWNPASFTCDPEEDNFRFFLRINPIGPVILINDPKDVDSGTSPIALCLPGVFFKFNRVYLGILTGEESLANLSRFKKSSIFNGNDYEYSRYTDIALRLRFAPKVSMGVGVQAVYQNPDNGGKRWGYQYGILIKPKSYLHVGLCYYNFNNHLSDTRMNLERIPDETLNIGVAIRPLSQILISLDMRNVSDDHQPATLEPHFGTEIAPFQQFRLRGGFFRNRDTQYSVCSAGFGYECQPLNSGNYFLSRLQWGIDATYVWEEALSGMIEWGLLNFYITL